MEQVERQRNDLAHYLADREYDLHRNVRHAILPDDEPWKRWHRESRERVEKQWIDCVDYCYTSE
jgi:hypothetical protein